jgi:hypothetical protein
MNDRNETGPQELLPPDDLRFDRLVDGSLPADEYRALVAALDHEPGGWRSCALAFLESQALAEELGGLRRSLDLRPAPAARVATWGGGLPGLHTLLAMAASFAVAFGLGIALPGIWRPVGQEPAPGGNLKQGGLVSAEGAGHPMQRPIGNVRVVVNGAGGQPADSGEVPVFEIGQSFDEYLEQSQPGLDPYVLQWLRQQGHQIEMQQQYIPGQLEDGRPIYVPVEQYKITPVKRSY